MKMLRMLAAATLAVGLSESARADTVGLAMMPQGTLGSSIANDLNEKIDVGAVSQPNSGETALIPLVNLGELDFGIVNIFYRPRLAPSSHAFSCIRRASRDHQCSAIFRPANNKTDHQVGLFRRHSSLERNPRQGNGFTEIH